MKKIFLFLLITTFSLFGDAPKHKVCLNMIVKDETPVIRRCLASVKPLIDYWVIVDTGSSDGTQEMIREFMKEIPGELHERPWVNFAHNRNEALLLGKGKALYLLFIDADEELSYTQDFKLPPLDKDFYYIKTSYGGMEYNRVQLINNNLDWNWVGVVHEALHSPQAKTSDVLQGVINIVRPEGNRSKDPQKFQKDAAAIEKALKDDPTNTRYTFYLAQSYRDGGELEKALTTYEKRVLMGGWDQEIFWSMLQIGLLKERLEKDPIEIINSYKKAHVYRPSRLEPLYYLSRYERKLNHHAESYQASSKGLTLKKPNDLLFVENWIQDYGMLLEYSVSAYWTERYIESLVASNALLANPSIPQNVRECVEKNLVWIHKKIEETNVSSIEAVLKNEEKRFVVPKEEPVLKILEEVKEKNQNSSNKELHPKNPEKIPQRKPSAHELNKKNRPLNSNADQTTSQKNKEMPSSSRSNTEIHLENSNSKHTFIHQKENIEQIIYPEKEICLTQKPFYEEYVSSFTGQIYSGITLGRSIGNVHSYQTLGGYVDWDRGCYLPFIDMRIHNAEDNRWSSNCGVGLRYYEPHTSSILGINVFYDYRHTHSALQQVGIGLEWMTTYLDFTTNYYLPISNKSHFRKETVFNYPGDYTAIRRERRRALTGGDFEIGTSCSRWTDCHSSIDLYTALGCYHYTGDNQGGRGSFTGGRIRAEINIYDLIFLSIQSTIDDIFKTVLQGTVSFVCPFDCSGLALCRQFLDGCFWNRGSRKATQRNSMIVESRPSCHWEANF